VTRSLQNVSEETSYSNAVDVRTVSDGTPANRVSLSEFN